MFREFGGAIIMGKESVIYSIVLCY